MRLLLFTFFLLFPLEDVSFGGESVSYNVSLRGGAPNTTHYSTEGVSSGPLKDIHTGKDTGVTLTLIGKNAKPSVNVNNPFPETSDAFKFFHPYVDPPKTLGLVLTGEASHTHLFTGLQAKQPYSFVGSIAQNVSGWSLIELQGAESSIPAHSEGRGVIVNPFGNNANQVALWSGDDPKSDQGWIVSWLEIVPGADGSFSVVQTPYIGPGARDNAIGYGFTAVRLGRVPEPAAFLGLGMGLILIFYLRFFKTQRLGREAREKSVG